MRDHEPAQQVAKYAKVCSFDKICGWDRSHPEVSRLHHPNIFAVHVLVANPAANYTVSHTVTAVQNRHAPSNAEGHVRTPSSPQPLGFDLTCHTLEVQAGGVGSIALPSSAMHARELIKGHACMAGHQRAVVCRPLNCRTGSSRAGRRVGSFLLASKASAACTPNHFYINN